MDEMDTRRFGGECMHDDAYLMEFDIHYGKWNCDNCGFSALPSVAGVLTDAVLQLSAEDSDAKHKSGIHLDTLVAFEPFRELSDDEPS